ncbi:MAG: tRNA preQ1(34) S-adenosylmethionine ribosyltransferase-isomerase QueA [Gammaproteobacteria bacterium]|nr:MAG: tRNA preQ1(34) S-adenosylmethionine ribosyltransferase-isomerase QueA [Gammaproteobacteria bacterium]
MKTQDFTYNLPTELIAQEPLSDRSKSRLLTVNRDTKEVADKNFAQIIEYLRPNDLLIFNNTRVINARMFGQKETGGKIEVLVERVIDSHTVLAHLKSSKAPKAGAKLTLEGKLDVTVLGRQGQNGELFHLGFGGEIPVLEILEQYGHVPLPPYIERDDRESDKSRYQTVFATEPGAVAAPTAGLHFDDEIITQISELGVEICYVTLHVGAGTFQPVRVDDVKDHKMHSEIVEVNEEVCEQIAKAKAAGGRVIAVGTTVVRSLESAAKNGVLSPYSDETDIFIYPGFDYKVVDALLTNFHLPASTLLMLVSAFTGPGVEGKQLIMNAYEHAVAEKYRFFSYGDAMFIY